jgi:hypothetical protein
MPSCHGREIIYLPHFLSWVGVYRQMFSIVEFAHMLCLCNSICTPGKNIEMIMMILMITMTMMLITMMSKRRSRGYLRTVTVKTVQKTPHFILYSSISVHCHTVSSLFRLPHSISKVLTEIYLHIISLVKRNISCREAQKLSFCLWISTCKWNKTRLQMTENTRHVYAWLNEENVVEKQSHVGRVAIVRFK